MPPRKRFIPQYCDLERIWHIHDTIRHLNGGTRASEADCQQACDRLNEKYEEKGLNAVFGPRLRKRRVRIR